jgi:hypothetical protein
MIEELECIEPTLVFRPKALQKAIAEVGAKRFKMTPQECEDWQETMQQRVTKTGG